MLHHTPSLRVQGRSRRSRHCAIAQTQSLGSVDIQHMSVRKRLSALGLIGLCTLLLPGCSGHYMVRDPATNNSYFTRDVDHPGFAGAVRFHDERTGSVVTLEESEVTKISPEEYRRNVKE